MQNHEFSEYEQVFVPHSMEAEQAVIGGALLDPSAAQDVLEIVSAADFFRLQHRQIFDAIAGLVNTGAFVDVITVNDAIVAAGGDHMMGYLVDLASSVAGTSNMKAYASIVFDRSIKRKVLAAASSVSEYVIKTLDATTEDVVNMAQTALIDIADRSDRMTRERSASEALKTYVQELDRRRLQGDALQGFSSGLPSLDRTTNGYKRGNLIVIAGRPGMGKTSIALQQVTTMSIFARLRGMIFSLEMSEMELTEKIIACHGQIPMDHLQKPGEVSDDRFWSAVENVAGLIKGSPFSIVECPGMHINQLKSYARKAHRREKLDWIMVDHIHIMSADGQSRERQISHISADLKALAGELQVSVFALAQLNRNLESRRFEDRAPRISDLRDSGGIEQDADMIQLIFRPDYYTDNPNQSNEGLVQIEIAKNRSGKKGVHIYQNLFSESRITEAPPGSYINLVAPKPPKNTKKGDL